MLKPRSVFKKYEWEYRSSGGEVWIFVVVEQGDQRNVKFFKEGNEDSSITIEIDFLLAMAKQIQEMGGSSTAAPGSLARPSIVDFRPASTASEIDGSVRQSMQRLDDDVRPFESFNQQDKADAKGQDDKMDPSEAL